MLQPKKCCVAGNQHYLVDVMKRFLIVTLLALVAVSAFAQYRRQCAWIKKNGQQCMNNAIDGSIYCHTHTK